MEHYTLLRTAQVCALAAFYIMYLYKRREMYAIFKMYSSRNVESETCMSKSAPKFSRFMRKEYCIIRIPSIVYM